MDRDLREFLVTNRLAAEGARIACESLPGGVSCDVWRVEADGGVICVKRPLQRLRVAACWEAPVSRSTQEREWLTFAQTVAPGSVPKPIAHDPVRGFLALEYLDPAKHPIWKRALLEGRIEPDFAAAVARLLAKLHAASAADPVLAVRFDTGEAFFALRIDAYLLEAAHKNPNVSGPLMRLARELFAAKIALVHGDVSPKNTLSGPEGPVLLDAETAWFGDPAFDLAFCLNHLLLKCLARPHFADGYLSCFEAFRSAYLACVNWEAPCGLDGRASRLLPGLLLARVDGKSPVEYLIEPDKALVRSVACRLLATPAKNLAQIAEAWRRAITSSAG